jgi:uncharacterized protein (DUF924 family)/predicted GNAT family acetyltransferase
MNMLDLRHDEGARRFEASVDGRICELDYQRDGERLIITHTGTDPALRGRGLAGQLVEQVLAWLAPQGLQLVPACSYVQAHLARHPRWLRLTETAPVQAVLSFWFGAPGSAEDGQVREVWFQKNEAFDAEIRQRFGATTQTAQQGGLRDWERSTLGRLARIVVLDQFSRNLHRGQAQAFAGDAAALHSALQLLDGPGYAGLDSLQRWFVLMPLEHAEDLSLQQRCVREFEALASEDTRLAGALDYAQRHRHVIARFGRFPHRNAALARPSTAAEQAYLAQPGSGF